MGVCAARATVAVLQSSPINNKHYYIYIHYIYITRAVELYVAMAARLCLCVCVWVSELNENVGSVRVWLARSWENCWKRIKAV